MKRIEFLYPEYCFIFAENYNVDYLKRSSAEIEVIETNHKETPKFVTEDVDMVYIGCLTEKKQEEVAALLMPYKERIIELIEKGTVFLVTGNSIELFGNYIKDKERKIDCLGIFNYYAERYMDVVRHNSLFIGEFDGMEIVGHRSQFSFIYGDDFKPFMNLTKGIGMDKKSTVEGVHVNNFFATYSLGPFLVVNPLFAKYILKLMDIDTPLLFEKEAVEAYEVRLDELKNGIRKEAK